MEKSVHGTLKGAVTPPPSKSQAHRLLICAALGTEPCSIVCSSVNDDIMATMRCLNALGARITFSSGVFDVQPIELVKGGTLDCGESGSTLRFFIPIALALGGKIRFYGTERLISRGFTVYEEICKEQNIAFQNIRNLNTVFFEKGLLHGL